MRFKSSPAASLPASVASAEERTRSVGGVSWRRRSASQSASVSRGRSKPRRAAASTTTQSKHSSGRSAAVTSPARVSGRTSSSLLNSYCLLCDALRGTSTATTRFARRLSISAWLSSATPALRTQSPVRISCGATRSSSFADGAAIIFAGCRAATRTHSSRGLRACIMPKLQRLTDQMSTARVMMSKQASVRMRERAETSG